ncbi:MAG TPA: hypothetical protein VIT91_17845 [Chthoniobacterales bacterium]
MSYADIIISDWFHIDPKQVRIEARDIETLISDHGGDTSNPSVIERAVYRSLGQRYRWKNTAKKQEIEGDKKLSEAAYNRFIENRK